MKSCVHVYTGDGKGKTTAAVGLAVRAAGQGLTVKFVQFLKGRDSGELLILRKINEIEVLRVSDFLPFFHQLDDKQKAKMREDTVIALTRIKTWLGSADMLILDEAMAALSCGLLKQDEVTDIIDNRGKTEIVLTGRNAPKQIINRAHLVTYMRSVKHYFCKGFCARKGIEY